jgi:hypothetical protein
MNDDEIKDFFKQVKGKKITFASEREKPHMWYFVPHSLKGDDMYGVDEDGKNTWWPIGDGFVLTDQDKCPWEYYIGDTRLGKLYLDK